MVRRKILRLTAAFVVAVLVCAMSMPYAFAAQQTKKLSVFSLDAGRKYFTEQQIEDIISRISDAGYTHLHLLVGNDGLRFVLNDMTIEANGKTYASDDVKAAVDYGNQEYFKHAGVSDMSSNKVLTQAEMDRIFEFAAQKNIKIIPGLNMPGHMDTILYMMQKLGMENVQFSQGGATSTTTINLKNSEAKNFAFSVLLKYVKYFNSKGVEAFNFGADEFANDVAHKLRKDSGFQLIQDNGQYDSADGFVGYVNRAAEIVKSRGLRPMAFNDGIYYNSVTTSIPFDTDILVSYWIAGYWGYNLSSADSLSKKGFEILNTNDAWYAVVGVNNNTDSGRLRNPYNLEKALDKMKQSGAKFDRVSIRGNGTNPETIGSMVCLWCDYPGETYEPELAFKQIETFAAQNPTYVVKDDRTASIRSVEKEADYTAVDTAIAKIPEDLSIYTDQSVLALKKAFRAVERNKMQRAQDEVDKYAHDIETAIAGLVEKPGKVDKETMTDPVDAPETAEIGIQAGGFVSVASQTDPIEAPAPVEKADAQTQTTSATTISTQTETTDAEVPVVNDSQEDPQSNSVSPASTLALPAASAAEVDLPAAAVAESPAPATNEVTEPVNTTASPVVQDQAVQTDKEDEASAASAQEKPEVQPTPVKEQSDEQPPVASTQTKRSARAATPSTADAALAVSGIVTLGGVLTGAALLKRKFF